LEGGFFTGEFERQVKEGSGGGPSLSMGALRGGPGGGLLYWGLIKICKRRLWKWNIFLYVGVS
jgi:tetrahydromethanopterin S-methyltransferase subunit D